MLSRHSSGVNETHLIISSSMCWPTSFQVSRGLHSTANPRPILTATGARDSESTENLGAPLVQCIALFVDVTVYGNTKCEPPQKSKEVALVRCLIPETDMPCGHTAKLQESIVFPQDCSAPEIYGATVLHESPTGSALNLFSHATTKSAKVTRDNELTSQEDFFPLRARGQAPTQSCVVLTARTVKKTVEAAQGQFHIQSSRRVTAETTPQS